MLRVLPHVPDAVKRLLLRRRTVTVDGNTLDTTLQFMLAAQRSAGVNGLVASSDVAVARSQLRTLSAMIDAGISVGVRDSTIPGPTGPLPVRHYTPADVSVSGGTSRERSSAGPAPLLVFFHGGGFVVGDLETHDALCRLLCRDAGIHVMAVDYRLAPEHPAPAAVDDCYAAYRWALAHAAELGADPTRVAVGGDSAGGNLAAVVSQLARNDDITVPALQVLLYPATDFSSDTRSKTLFAENFFLTKKDMDWFRDNYLTGSALDVGDPRVSPLLADDLSGLPPAMVLTGGFDPLRDEGNQYAEALAAAGVPVDHRQFGPVVHAFANFFPLGGASATATAEVVSAVRAHLSRA
ncbi:alpha/beta hydrolase [Mycobacterium sp. NPDC006124]|uniref:alpha/beta hydrolase n=1 Tax=Mycobacterium sp. NPDC006124 TaxID=3156729 RepID=UPI0033BD8F36